MTGSETERFDRVVLIFNPDPDKAPRRLARALHAAVRQRMPGTPVHERPTHWAGHGRELARAEAGRGRPLLVSVSGDGGFNDVVNGIMDVPGNTAVAAVMAGGNA